MRLPHLHSMLPPWPAPLWAGWLAVVLGVVTPGQAATSLELGEVSGRPGTTVMVPVMLRSDFPVVAAEFEVHYTSPNLQVQPMETGSAAATHRLQSVSSSPGVQRGVLYSVVNAVMGNGVIARVPIRLLGNAPDVRVSLTLAGVLLVAGDGSEVAPVTLSEGLLTISGVAFESITRGSDGVVALEIIARPDQEYVIQSSPSFDPPAWSNLSTNVATNGVIRVHDTAAGQTLRYYRAVGIP